MTLLDRLDDWKDRLTHKRRVDPAWGDSQASACIAAMWSGDIGPTKALLSGLRSGPWDTRSFYATVLGDDASPVDALSDWVAREPDNPDAQLLYGFRMHAWAAEARTAARAAEVSETRWQLFHERCTEAMQFLSLAAESIPGDPTPLGKMIRITMAAGGTLEEGRDLFERAMARDPTDYAAHVGLGYLLCEKWLGSHDLMFAFAEAVARHPAHPDLLAVFARAHLERWLYHQSFDDRPKSASSYLRNGRVLRPFTDAFDQTMGSNAYVPRKTSVFAWNMVAIWFYMTRDGARLRLALDRINGGFGEIVWAYADVDAETAIRRALRFAR